MTLFTFSEILSQSRVLLLLKASAKFTIITTEAAFVQIFAKSVKNRRGQFSSDLTQKNSKY